MKKQKVETAKKIQTKKIKLARETLRQLNGEALAQVNGGGGTDTAGNSRQNIVC